MSPSTAPGEPTGGPRGSKPTTLAAGLYLVATPIGNLADITLRALTTLASADVIACEDQRVTRKLLQAHGIAPPSAGRPGKAAGDNITGSAKRLLISYHDHNAREMRPKLIERMRRGQAVALVSDAGTPLISDPGFKLVRAAVAEGLAVTTIPGPSAPLAALTLSGLESDRFCFAGFLPPRRGARCTELEALRDIPATLVFLESARRLAESLADMAKVLGERDGAVARELTKLFEEVRRGSLAELAAHYGTEGPPKGEVVVVVGPPPPPATPTAEALDGLLRQALESESLRDAATRVASETGLPRRQVYNRALEISRNAGAERS